MANKVNLTFCLLLFDEFSFSIDVLFLTYTKPSLHEMIIFINFLLALLTSRESSNNYKENYFA
jgi:hypothetical protein